MIKLFERKSKYRVAILELWRKIYCLVIPVIVTVLYTKACLKYGFKIYESENFTEALTALITFVSIIISFFGILLTMLIEIKETSELVKFFLRSIEKKDFVSAIKRLVMWGLFTVIMAIILFMIDILPEKIIIPITVITVYSLIRFTMLTYRFTNILLSLFINDKKSFRKAESNKLPDANRKKLDEALEHFE